MHDQAIQKTAEKIRKESAKSILSKAAQTTTTTRPTKHAADGCTYVLCVAI